MYWTGASRQSFASTQNHGPRTAGAERWSLTCLPDAHHVRCWVACSDRTPVVVHTERLDVPSLKVKSIVTGNTALIEAAAHGHAAAVDILLAAEVDVNIKNRAGFSALMCAAMHGHLEVLQRMVAWRRSPFARLHNRVKAVSPADLDKSLGIDLNETCRVRWKVAMQWWYPHDVNGVHVETDW